ncbi:MAG TPA: hypothetical protein VGJ86_08870 [Acidimicrobiales bacterium]|jgi:hypothetical protein
MLWFEREVVQALGSSTDQDTRSAVEAFVDGSLRAMPEVPRLGVLAETVLFGTYVKALAATGRLNGPEDLRVLLDRWESSRIGPVRLYVHVFRSLVLFGENELGSGVMGDAA